MNELIESVASLNPSELALLSTEEIREIEEYLDLQATATLRGYHERAWHVVEPATEYVHGWHADAICDHLQAVAQRQIHRLIINIPPRCEKSLLVSVFFPTWVWVEEPWTRFLFASYAQQLATRDSVKSRRVLQSPWYQQRWGNRFRLTSDQNEKTRYENDKGGYRISTSVGGVATGEGGDILVIDDPHKADEVHSEAKREGDLDWWKETWSTRKNDAKTSREIIVMQRLHERDLTGYALAEVGDFEHLCLPMEFEPVRKCVTSIGFEDKRTEPGELLAPERFGPEEVERLKKQLGSFGAAGQLQQRPAPVGGGMVLEKWWKFYRRPPVEFDEVLQSWDMNFKKTTSGSFVVGQVWGRLGSNKYLLEQFRGRIGFPQTLREVRAMSAKWPEAHLKLVEDKANGPAVIESLQNELSGIIAVKADVSKEARLAAVSPDIEAGNVWLPSDQDWVDDYIGEFNAFPNGANDDQVDATSQALARLYEGNQFAFVSDAESDVQAAREEQEAELAAIAAGERKNDLPYEASLDDYDLSRRRRM